MSDPSRAEAADAAHPADPDAGVVRATPPGRGARIAVAVTALVTALLFVALAIAVAQGD